MDLFTIYEDVDEETKKEEFRERFLVEFHRLIHYMRETAKVLLQRYVHKKQGGVYAPDTVIPMLSDKEHSPVRQIRLAWEESKNFLREDEKVITIIASYCDRNTVVRDIMLDEVLPQLRKFPVDSV